MHTLQVDRGRLLREQEFMRSRTTARLYEVDGCLTWVEELRSTATRQPFTLSITYPLRFPHEPPRAYILRPSVIGAPHLLGDGSLCIWDDPAVGDGVRTTALMVRSRAVVWFLAFEIWKATGTWEAPEHRR